MFQTQMYTNIKQTWQIFFPLMKLSQKMWIILKPFIVSFIHHLKSVPYPLAVSIIKIAFIWDRFQDHRRGLFRNLKRKYILRFLNRKKNQKKIRALQKNKHWNNKDQISLYLIGIIAQSRSIYFRTKIPLQKVRKNDLLANTL
jgi:hypothetical protein